MCKREEISLPLYSICFPVNQRTGEKEKLATRLTANILHRNIPMEPSSSGAQMKA